jgi:hypothetical protein
MVPVPGAVAVGMVVILLWFWAGSRRYVAWDKFVEVLGRSCALRNKSNADSSCSANLRANLEADRLLNLADILYRPSTWDKEIQVDEIVLTRLDARHIPKFDFVAVGYGLKLLLDLLPNRQRDVVIETLVGEFLHGRHGVLESCLDDKERDEKATHRV